MYHVCPHNVNLAVYIVAGSAHLPWRLSAFRPTLCRIMLELDLSAEEAADWFAGQAAAKPGEWFNSHSVPRRPRHRPQRRPRQLHLLLGDSVARDAWLASRFRGDAVFNRARGGETWHTLADRIDVDIAAWWTAAEKRGLPVGTVIIWLTGNDVYNRYSLMASFTEDTLDAIGRTAREVVRRLRQHADRVLLLGPLPRLAGEIEGCTWEGTAAYHLERTLLKADLGDGVTLAELGRALTRKMGRKRRGLKGTRDWYKPDRVHLSQDGYVKVEEATHFPVWLTLRRPRQ